MGESQNLHRSVICSKSNSKYNIENLMPAKVAKQQRRGKNNKRHSNKHSHNNQNHKKKPQNEKSIKLKKSKMTNGHQNNQNNHQTQNGTSKILKNSIQNTPSNEALKEETNTGKK